VIAPSTFDAVVFVGYHAREGAPEAVLAHTDNGSTAWKCRKRASILRLKKTTPAHARSGDSEQASTVAGRFPGLRASICRMIRTALKSE
jgi:hypothetical protein